MIIFKLILHKDYQHYYEDSSVLSLLVQDHNNVQCDPRILQLM